MHFLNDAIDGKLPIYRGVSAMLTRFLRSGMESVEVLKSKFPHQMSQNLGGGGGGGGQGEREEVLRFSNSNIDLRTSKPPTSKT